jgi:methionyl-tRNA formyltransferase
VFFLRLVFLGTADYAVPSLKTIVQEGYKVLTVITQPDRPKGRGQKVKFSPIKKAALKLNLPIFQPENIKTSESVDYLKELKADLYVVVAYGQILSKEILDLPPMGCVNVHGSLLPKYRGAAPIHWAIINGEVETGVTTMYMVPDLDSGDIIEQSRLKIEPDYSVGILHDLLADLGAKTLLSTLRALAKGSVNPTPQDDSKATYAPQLKKKDEIIQWGKTSEQVVNHIRGMNPWPGAYTTYHGKILKVLEAKTENSTQSLAPGTILQVDKNGIIVQCGQGAIRLTLLKPQGKKEMAADAFSNGQSFIKPGFILGV